MLLPCPSAVRRLRCCAQVRSCGDRSEPVVGAGPVVARSRRVWPRGSGPRTSSGRSLRAIYVCRAGVGCAPPVHMGPKREAGAHARWTRSGDGTRTREKGRHEWARLGLRWEPRRSPAHLVAISLLAFAGTPLATACLSGSASSPARGPRTAVSAARRPECAIGSTAVHMRTLSRADGRGRGRWRGPRGAGRAISTMGMQCALPPVVRRGPWRGAGHVHHCCSAQRQQSQGLIHRPRARR